MLEIVQERTRLVLQYAADFNDPQWVDKELQEHGEVTLGRTFTFRASDLISAGDSAADARTFLLGVVDGHHYKISARILRLKNDLKLAQDLRIARKTFIAHRQISIFKKIDAVTDEPIVVGGGDPSSTFISPTDFQKLLDTFPTSTELDHYAHARIGRALKEYLGTKSDPERKLDDYLKRKRKIQLSSASRPDIEDFEIAKFEYVRDELRDKLKDADSYSEKEWQNLIIGFLLILFPKYVAVLDNLQIKDFYSKPGKVKNRYIDLTLVDASGTMDIVEIKKPFSDCLLSPRKYRDNYTPQTELSGAVMQVEKYIFHLNKWGREGEQTIAQKRKNDLPAGFEIRITNPKAMIIMGRDNDFTMEQTFDFEIIKRKYANVIDVMTYDDLLRRLEAVLSMLNTRRQST